MAVALLGARLALGLVFLIAGVAKGFDVSGTRSAAADFGLPRRFTGAVAFLLPVCELAVAALLVPRVTAAAGAASAALLLGCFAALIGRALIRGEQPDCHCFGQIHSAAAGPKALLRNLALGGLAVFVAAAGWHDPGLSATGWVGSLSATQVAGLIGGALLGSAVALLGWFSLQLLRQQGRLLLRIEALENSPGSPQADASAPQMPAGLHVGTPAPEFALKTTDGESFSLQTLRERERPIVLIFSDPQCGPCEALLPEVARWQEEYALTVSVALISRGEVDVNEARRLEHGLKLMLLEEEREVSHAYRAYGTPSAVIVTPDGLIASALARGAHEIRVTVAQAASTADVPTRPGWQEEEIREEAAAQFDVLKVEA